MKIAPWLIEIVCLSRDMMESNKLHEASYFFQRAVLLDPRRQNPGYKRVEALWSARLPTSPRARPTPPQNTKRVRAATGALLGVRPLQSLDQITRNHSRLGGHHQAGDRPQSLEGLDETRQSEAAEGWCREDQQRPEDGRGGPHGVGATTRRELCFLLGGRGGGLPLLDAADA